MDSAGDRRIYGLLTAIMFALAAGAVWCVVALALRHELSLMAFPVGAAVAWPLRRYGYATTWSGALLGAVGTALACFYSQYLLATAEIASIFALPFRESLVKSGFAMTTDLMVKRLDMIDFAGFGAAIVFTALLVMRKR